MKIEFEAIIPVVDSGRLLMEVPAKAAAKLEKESSQKVNAIINSKTYSCNLFYKEDRFYLHITRGIKRDVGLGAKTVFTIEIIDNGGGTEDDIHDQVLKWEIAECKALMRKVGIKTNDRVIDFGCGYGHYTIGCALALEQTGEVLALDCDKKALKWINEKEKMHILNNIKTIHTNSEATIDFPDNSLDVILLYDVIHIQDKKSKKSLASMLYKEAYRVLKRGGILSTLNFDSDIKKMTVENEDRRMTADDIARDIIDSGFSFSHAVDGGVHFDWYHSNYRLDKGLDFSDLERGMIQNYVKRM
ncbi:class I SAM-dependent methyltransferase [Enterococcus larvae]|uniref:class I SAM-dependent methyltransferase n=1 Tax=Enterococcus larvae TaxID=2794352 RepID=UPI003F3097B9